MYLFFSFRAMFLRSLASSVFIVLHVVLCVLRLLRVEVVSDCCPLSYWVLYCNRFFKFIVLCLWGCVLATADHCKINNHAGALATADHLL